MTGMVSQTMSVFSTVDISPSLKDFYTEVEKPKKKVLPLSQIYRYASRYECFLLVMGAISAIIAGLGPPLSIVFFGQISKVFVLHASAYTKIYKTEEIKYAKENFMKEVYKFVIEMFAVSILELLFCYFMIICFSTAATKQLLRIRKLFIESVLRQDISWFDIHSPADFAMKSVENLDKIQDGIGERICIFFYYITSFVNGVFIGFYFGWKLTMVTLAFTPVLLLIIIIFAKITSRITNKELAAYSKAAAIAEENFSGIRTVVAFAGEKVAYKKYKSKLKLAVKADRNRARIIASGTALTWLIIYVSYANAFWYGIQLIAESSEKETYEYDPSSLLIIFYCALIGSLNIGLSTPHFEAFNVARIAAFSIYEVIEQVPVINSSDDQGEKLTDLIGDIQFSDVFFNYPARPHAPVLNGFSLKINNGTMVALVGSSGSGKSTILQLLLRFYDPLYGVVLLDGVDIRTLNVQWLRQSIGVVGQEPVLFEMTIRENILLGTDQEVTMNEVEEAARAANAHDFISKLPQGYDTMVGEKGAQLSGGQKQRIAIARALIKNPQILLLDEATSALDTQSEAVVQAALDKAGTGRTTIVVAHRLSTIRNANVIVAMERGKIIEMGTHDELMKNKKLYYDLVVAQIPEEKDYEAIVQSPLEEAVFNGSPTLSVGQFVSPVDHQIISSDVASENGIKKTKKKTNTLLQIFKFGKPQSLRLFFGSIASIGFGLIMPSYAIIFGEITGLLSLPSLSEMKKKSIIFCLLFIAVGVWAALCSFVQIYLFTRAGSKLAFKLRKRFFSVILRQEIGWFDLPENSTGALCSRLSADAANVQGIIGMRIGLLLQAITALSVSVGIGIYLVYKQALVSIVFVPVLFIFSYIQSKLLMGGVTSDIEAHEKSGKVAIEAIANIRTVAILCKEQYFADIYIARVAHLKKRSIKYAHVRGALFGFAQFTLEFSYAISMWYGAYLILYENVNYKNVFKVAELIVFGTLIVGQSIASAPGYNKGITSAERIFKLLNRKTKIDSYGQGGNILPEAGRRNIEFYRVTFSYPNRPEAEILKGISFSIETGQTVALVGSSGCGKSTCIQLLERFYDPSSGVILLANQNIEDLNVSWLRWQFGLVQQEPVLFQGSIAENIAYGDNSRLVPVDEIISAAKKANIHSFIMNLEEGYNTNVGGKGTHLSGGQKQRIAIARALVRDPKILLLDEATSALDTESEKVVQAALDEAMVGRTSIVIAHRLTTIQNADKIIVFSAGKVIEEGDHNSLMARRGHYYNLQSVH